MTTQFGTRSIMAGSAFFPAPPPVKRPNQRPCVPPRLVPLSPAQQALRVACLMYGVTLAELRGPGRYRLQVLARHYAAVRLTMECGLGPAATGRLLNRDHSSVISLLGRSRRHARWREPCSAGVWP